MIVSSQKKCPGQSFKQWNRLHRLTSHTCLPPSQQTLVCLTCYYLSLIKSHSVQHFLRKCLAAIRFHLRNPERINPRAEGSRHRWISSSWKTYSMTADFLRFVGSIAFLTNWFLRSSVQDIWFERFHAKQTREINWEGKWSLTGRESCSE